MQKNHLKTYFSVSIMEVFEAQKQSKSRLNNYYFWES